MKNRNVPVLPLLLSIATFLSAQNHVCFLGITENGTPGSRETFEQQLRNVLDTMEGVTLTDYVASMRYREIAELDRYTRSSRDLLAKLVYHIPDTVLVIWGTLQSIDFQIVRKRIFGAEVQGTLTSEISVFSLKQRSFLYNGNVTGSITAKESPAYFSPVEKVTHLSASERARLTDSLIHLTVINCSEVIRSILKESGKISADYADDAAAKRNTPSISDVFTVPSVEAPQIKREEAEKKTSTPAPDDQPPTQPK